MRIVFMGTPNFACPCLEALHRGGHLVSLVVTRCDKPRGRSSKPVPPEVKQIALRLGLPVLQTEDVNHPHAIATIRQSAPDLIVTAAFGQKLSRELLALPRWGAINVHASLLPKYRGAAPINWAIICGETVTGVTIFRMDERLDAGDIISQVSTPIHPDETAGELTFRLAALGAELLAKTVAEIEAGRATYRPQDGQAATFAPLLKKEHGVIDWRRSASEIRNFVRGMTPWPGAFSFLTSSQGTEPLRLIILKAEVVSGAPTLFSPPGTVMKVMPEHFQVATGQGVLAIMRVKPAGGREMSCAEFLRGHTVHMDDRFISNVT